MFNSNIPVSLVANIGLTLCCWCPGPNGLLLFSLRKVCGFKLQQLLVTFMKL